MSPLSPTRPGRDERSPEGGVVPRVEVGPGDMIRCVTGRVDDGRELSEVLGESAGTECADDSTDGGAPVAEGVGNASRDVEEGPRRCSHRFVVEDELEISVHDEEGLVVGPVDVLGRTNR